MHVFRTVYHCPFCNLCRLGIDFFHHMTCNYCLGIKLVDHKCREKGLETNCPICCDFLFTSSAAVRALPCGHFMHSACFQVAPHYMLTPSFHIFKTFFSFWTSFFFTFVRLMHAHTTFVQYAANLWEICR